MSITVCVTHRRAQPEMRRRPLVSSRENALCGARLDDNRGDWVWEGSLTPEAVSFTAGDRDGAQIERV